MAAANSPSQYEFCVLEVHDACYVKSRKECVYCFKVIYASYWVPIKHIDQHVLDMQVQPWSDIDDSNQHDLQTDSLICN